MKGCGLKTRTHHRGCGGKKWKDGEADEVVFAKTTEADEPDETANTDWEQWAGLVERGRPETLVLWKTKSTKTCKRAPGPGAIKKIDWMLVARLENRLMVLHTDRAKSYTAKVDGMIHDTVRHSKKRVKFGGKLVIKKTCYTKLVTHTLRGGGNVSGKAGTQIIDRAWQLVKAHLKCMNSTANSTRLAAAVRSAQWLYWQRRTDLWVKTAQMLRGNRAA